MADPLSFLAVVGTIYVVRKVSEGISEWLNQNQSTTISTSSVSSIPVLPPISSVVTLVGATGVGKSSTGNALLERAIFQTCVTHGSTKLIEEQDFHKGYRIRDTPGLLDGPEYTEIVRKAIEDSHIVVFMAKGQLYRQEMEQFEWILNRQKQLNGKEKTHKRRQLLLFINMQDIASQTMPISMREKQREEIFRQMAGLIPKKSVLFGAAAPVRDQKQEIDSLRTAILECIDESTN